MLKVQRSGRQLFRFRTLQKSWFISKYRVNLKNFENWELTKISGVWKFAGLPEQTWCPIEPYIQSLADYLTLFQSGEQIMLTTLLLALPRFQTFLRPCVLSRTCQGPPKSGQFSNLEKQVEPRRNCYAQNVKSCSFHIKYFKSNKKTLTEIKKKK